MPPVESILEGVRRLEPGHLLTLRPGESPKVYRYWDVAFGAGDADDPARIIAGIRGRLEESVRLRMRADGPVGALLGGGIGSGAVVATMVGQSAALVKTFSIGLPGGGGDGLSRARRVAEVFGTDHHEIFLDQDDNLRLRQPVQVGGKHLSAKCRVQRVGDGALDRA